MRRLVKHILIVALLTGFFLPTTAYSLDLTCGESTASVVDFASVTRALNAAGIDTDKIKVAIYPQKLHFPAANSFIKYNVVVTYAGQFAGFIHANIEAKTHLTFDSSAAIHDSRFRRKGLGAWLYLLLGKYFYTHDRATLKSSGSYVSPDRDDPDTKPGKLLWQKLKRLGFADGQALSYQEEHSENGERSIPRLSLSRRFLDSDAAAPEKWIELKPPLRLLATEVLHRCQNSIPLEEF